MARLPIIPNPPGEGSRDITTPASRRRRAFRPTATRSLQMSPSVRAIPSPCIGVCMLDEERLCLGCHRSVEEITRWVELGDVERRRLVEEELPRRARLRTR